MKKQSDIGLIGLAVMGENLALNFANKGFVVAAWDRDSTVRNAFAKGRASDRTILVTDSLETMAANLEKPRKVMMMVKAGEVVDQVLEQLLPCLEAGDIVIDGGNSHFEDTQRRASALKDHGIHFIGAGVSGGEEGALNGPAIMPGGSVEAWPRIKPLLQAVSASVNHTPCCDWIGEGGAGHFVKMVHNGIEYGDMQLICESYQFMKEVLELSGDEICQAYTMWNEGPLSSYLIEITANITRYEENGSLLLDHIMDAAGQKGTGKWTVITALQTGSPLTLITEAVLARNLSARKDERVTASQALQGPEARFSGDKSAMIDALEQALLSARIISYAQGFSLLRDAAGLYNWSLDYAGIARCWRGGCIIRSSLLDPISNAFTSNPDLANLLLDSHFMEIINQTQAGWRKITSSAIEHGIPCPAISSSLAYFDGYRCANLPANLLQAQRDYFGAHTYERTDRPRGEFFHTDWTGQGGSTSSTTYDA